MLASAQSLYENKLTSYPRTEDAYITEENYNKIKTYLPNLVHQCLNVSNFSFPGTTPASVNGTKITGSHDALVPTGQTNGIEKLSEQDRHIFELILYRCLESFSEVAIYEKGVYEFENQTIPFKTYTSNLVQEGWKKYTPKSKNKSTDDEENDEEANFLLQLPYRQGDKVGVEKKNLKEIESKPPSIYTPASLTEDLCNLSKFLQEQSPEVYAELQKEFDLKGLEIGTKGTRPGIIEILVKTRKYIAFEKNKKIWYAYSDEELDNILKEVGRDQNNKIQRYKGLGEMDAEQLWETTMDPERRVLKKVVLDESMLSETDLTFNTLMGDQVAPRREFIETNAKYVSNLDI